MFAMAEFFSYAGEQEYQIQTPKRLMSLSHFTTAAGYLLWSQEKVILWLLSNQTALKHGLSKQYILSTKAYIVKHILFVCFVCLF